MKTLINILGKFIKRLVKRFKKKKTMIDKRLVQNMKSEIETLMTQMSQSYAKDENGPAAKICEKLHIRLPAISDLLIELDRNIDGIQPS